MSQEIAIMDTITIARPPELVLEEAHKAAAALKKILDAKPKKVMMNGEQYLEFEDWQTVGKFYGVTVKVVSTSPVEFGSARGFEAVASVLRSDGQEVSRAESMCLDDEEKWSARTKYEEVNGVRTPVGKIAVPLFQLKSMAQTRACAKALRNVLAWVVVLAGYKPTPAEEMDGVPGVKTSNGSTPPPPPTGNANEINAVIEGVKEKSGVSAKTGKGWTLFTVEAGGERFTTFKTDLGALARTLIGKPACIGYTPGAKGNDLNHIAIVQEHATDERATFEAGDPGPA